VAATRDYHEGRSLSLEETAITKCVGCTSSIPSRPELPPQDRLSLVTSGRMNKHNNCCSLAFEMWARVSQRLRVFSPRIGNQLDWSSA